MTNITHTNEQARTKTFDVPANRIVEFAEILEENGLHACLMGTDEEILSVNVHYRRAKRAAIMQLIEMLEDETEEEEESEHED